MRIPCRSIRETARGAEYESSRSMFVLVVPSGFFSSAEADGTSLANISTSSCSSDESGDAGAVAGGGGEGVAASRSVISAALSLSFSISTASRASRMLQ